MGNIVIGQSRKEYKWCASVAINSIHAQIEVPIGTIIGGTGVVGAPMVVDADGNIIGRGNRKENSFSISIIPKYRLSEDFLLRTEFTYTDLNATAEFESNSLSNPILHLMNDHQVDLTIHRFGGGFLWQFVNEKRIESYCGLSAYYQNFGDVSISLYHETRSGIDDTLQSYVSITDDVPGGYALGIGAIIGFNIFLHKHISVGAEFSSSIMHYELGGEAKSYSSGHFVPDYYYTNTTIYTNSYTGTKVSKILSSFNISYWF